MKITIVNITPSSKDKFIIFNTEKSKTGSTLADCACAPVQIIILPGPLTFLPPMLMSTFFSCSYSEFPSFTPLPP
jgi:hypothetical protein